MTIRNGRLATLGFVLSLGPRTDRVRAVAVSAVSVLQQATGVGLAILLGYITNAAIDRDRERVVLFAILAGLCVLITQGAFIAGYFTRLRLREEIEAHAEHDLITALGTSPTLEIHERPDLRDKGALVRMLIGAMGQSFDFATMMIGAIGVLLVAVVLLASVVPVLALLPLFAVPSFVASQRAEKARNVAALAAMPKIRQALHLSDLTTSAGTGREVRLFGFAHEVESRHRTLWDQSGREMHMAELRARVKVAFAWIPFVAVYGAGAVLIARAGARGDASAGAAVTAIALMTLITSQVQMVLTWAYWSFEALTVAKSHREVIAEGARERNAPAAVPKVDVPATIEQGIRLENVSFRYWGQEHAVLRDLNVALPAGKVIALVGENGAGKSTLVKLLSRLYEPTSGHILVDGMDIADYDPDVWRSRITAAFQDFVRFEMTAQDVVGIGALEHREDRDLVMQSLIRVGAERLVASLPNGLDTRLGASWGGRELSGGQWQALANARAGMRRAPLLRILDEPTASLDARSEEWLYTQYAQLGRIEEGVTILVTHRFTTARVADLVVLLDHGRITEVGDHQSLRELGGTYATMFEAQARYFR